MSLINPFLSFALSTEKIRYLSLFITNTSAGSNSFMTSWAKSSFPALYSLIVFLLKIALIVLISFICISLFIPRNFSLFLLSFVRLFDHIILCRHYPVIGVVLLPYQRLWRKALASFTLFRVKSIILDYKYNLFDI